MGGGGGFDKHPWVERSLGMINGPGCNAMERVRGEEQP